jgi:glycogen synthase
MRILMTADAVGGVFTYALTLAQALTACGAEVCLAMMGPPMRPAQRADARAIAGVSLHESTYALEWMDDPWTDVATAGEWLRALERTLAPDFIHLNGYAHGAVGFDAPVTIVGHSCVLSWWEAVHGEPAPAAFEAYRRAVRRGLDGASLVAAPSKTMLDALARLYGPLPDAMVVPNGLALRASAAAEGAPPAKQPIVLSAARGWDPAKNVAALARIAPRAPWPIVIAGDTRAPAGERAVPLDGVTALGWISSADVASWMDRAAIFALPARYEPFGMSALEAAARGCALVLGDIPSQRELWGDDALFVAPDDDEAILRAVTNLATDGALRGALADRARRRAVTMTSRRTAVETLTAYARAARNANARAEEESSCA